jgi:hypothetical protein
MGMMTAIALIAGCADAAADSDVAPATATTFGGMPASGAGADAADGDEFPQILDVEATPDGDGVWSFDVTISSTYDTPDRYADGWRVIGADGTVYGVHTLAHDHAAEQPFTRRQAGVEIPADIHEVTIEGRDLVNGFGGVAKTIELSPRG